jgi:ABC-type xylose transport system substrate-binding protein
MAGIQFCLMPVQLIRRFLATLAAGGMLFATAACGQTHATQKSATATPQTSLESAHVEIFVPSDGITLTQNTPTNKWGGFSAALVKQLEEQGYSSDTLQVTTSGSLKDQADAMEKYLADKTDEEADTESSSEGEGAPAEAFSSAKGKDIVVLAPALTLDPATRQFGDLIGDGTRDLSSSSDISAAMSQDDLQEQTAAEKSISESAKELRSQGTKLILIARNLPSVTADAFVKTSNAYEIGALQAKQLAAKLELTEATASNPKKIEIVIPEQSSTTVSSDFFRGVWSVLGSYFTKGTVESPSGRLSQSSTADDWSQVTVPASTAKEAQTSFNTLLDDAVTTGDTGGPVKLDGVIAANDLLAMQVTTVLTNRGFTGSAADINPEITLGGIVGNMTGNTDITKTKVPTPAQEEDSASSSGTSYGQDSSAEDDDEKQWPIVTGYGSYVTNIQLIVSGKQWLTGLEDRSELVGDVAETCSSLVTSDTAKISKSQKTITLNGKKIPLISKPLVGIVGGNIKTELIDPGYITPADAGL